MLTRNQPWAICFSWRWLVSVWRKVPFSALICHSPFSPSLLAAKKFAIENHFVENGDRRLLRLRCELR